MYLSQTEFSKFLERFPENISSITLALRDFINSENPGCYELIYIKKNSLVFGLSNSEKAGDAFCSIVVYLKHVNFGFIRGSELIDDGKILCGGGNHYRYISVREISDFPLKKIRKLLKQAYVLSKAGTKKKDFVEEPASILKSDSLNKVDKQIKWLKIVR